MNEGVYRVPISLQQFRGLEKHLSSLETYSNKLVISPIKIHQIACMNTIEACQFSIEQLYGKDSNNFRHLIAATNGLPDNTDSNGAQEANDSEAIVSVSKSVSEVIEGILDAESHTLGQFSDGGLVT